jgi:uncharacterized membrane protein HdeD (DUF308 family)
LKKKFDLIPYLIEIILLISGILFIIHPNIIYKYLPLILGSIIILISFCKFLYYLATKNLTNNLFECLIGFTFGMIFICYTNSFIIIAAFFGLLEIILGYIKINKIITSKKISYKMFLAIFQILLGLFTIFNPFDGLNILTIIIGIHFISSAIDIFITMKYFK